MTNNTIPRVLESLELAALRPHANLLIVDVSARNTYEQSHLPGAVHVEYANLIGGQPPAVGLLPPNAQLENVFRAMCLSDDSHVVAYDDQGNGRASRLLWTLDLAGHSKWSLLNGGLRAWHAAGNALETMPAECDAPKAAFVPQWNPAVIADRAYIVDALDNPNIALVDARTAEEYGGLKSASARRGHIPGAVNLNWLDTMDADNHFGYLPVAELNAMVAQLGIRRDQEIITYCQTHHRSSHSFVMFRHLGFANVRGYPGSWAEWGNDSDLPIE